MDCKCWRKCDWEDTSWTWLLRGLGDVTRLLRFTPYRFTAEMKSCCRISPILWSYMYQQAACYVSVIEILSRKYRSEQQSCADNDVIVLIVNRKWTRFLIKQYSCIFIVMVVSYRHVIYVCYCSCLPPSSIYRVFHTLFIYLYTVHRSYWFYIFHLDIKIGTKQPH